MNVRLQERRESVDPGDVYLRLQRRFVETIRGADAEQWEWSVPATPAWRVRDVLAHVSLLAADLNAQRFPAADDPGGSAWSQSQVERGARCAVSTLIDDWHHEAIAFADGLRMFGYEFGSHFVADLHAHHQDVRAALGLTPDADALTVRVALDHYLGFVDEVLTTTGWGTLEVDADGEVRVLGTVAGAGRAWLTADPFEMLRSLAARRSRRQICALGVSGDVTGALDAIAGGLGGGYAFPDADVDD